MAAPTASADTVLGPFRNAADRCLENPNDATAPGSPVRIALCGAPTVTAQQFSRWSDGSIRTSAGRCLDAAGSGNNTPVVLAACSTASTSQRWTVRTDGTILNQKANRCLAPKGDGTAAGTAVVITACSTVPAQRWTVPAVSTPTTTTTTPTTTTPTTTVPTTTTTEPTTTTDPSTTTVPTTTTDPSTTTVPPTTTTVPPTTTTPPITVGSRLMFSGDYETGDFTQWGVCQSVAMNGNCAQLGQGDRSMAIVQGSAARQGQYAARFEVRPGDVPSFGGGERAEVQSNAAGALVHEGDERWYQWSVQYPADMPDVVGRYFIIMQWHSAAGSPPLAIDLSRGTVDIGGDGVLTAPRRTIGPIRRGEWVDYVLHVKFSRKADAGFVEAWENGQQTVPRTARATMVDRENYLKQGIYRPSQSTTVVSLTLDGLRVTAP
jgi:hypothetical protein